MGGGGESEETKDEHLSGLFSVATLNKGPEVRELIYISIDFGAHKESGGGGGGVDQAV